METVGNHLNRIMNTKPIANRLRITDDLSQAKCMYGVPKNH